MADPDSGGPAVPSPWTLRLIGCPALVAPHGATRIDLRPKDAAMLAVVALAGPVAPGRLTSWLWPDARGGRADNNLRQRLFRLRRDSGRQLVLAAPLLALAPDLRTDVEAALDALSSDPQAAREELLADLRFDELPELDDWLSAERRRWRTRRDDAIAAAAAECERRGALARGLLYAARLVESQPLAEHAHRRLMRLHYLRGDRAAAIAVFEALERLLKDEVGARPDAETLELLVTVERSTQPRPSRTPPIPVSLLRPPRLAGRRAEWRRLERTWDERRVFALVGEAGIGKSRLLADFGAAHAPVLAVSSRPGDAGVPYALAARMVRALLAQRPRLRDAVQRELALLLPELGSRPNLSGPAQRIARQRAVEGVLGASMGGGLVGVLVDDLHAADAASLELLQALVASEPLDGLRWGLAWRPAEASGREHAVIAGLIDAGTVETIPLGPLDLAGMVELLDSLGLPGLVPQRLAPSLLRHAGGNPLFALETLREVVRGGGPVGAGTVPLPQPATVDALIGRRLAQLSAPALRLARVAALAGPSFDAELAAAVLDTHPLDLAEPWRELETAQVIREGGFAHDLILETTRAGVPAPIAALLQGRIAEHLQARGAAAAVVAPHWVGAGRWLPAGEAFVAAARAALAASQRAHEVEHWRQAAEAFDRAGDRERAFRARCESVPGTIVAAGVGPARAMADSLLADARTDEERAAAQLARAQAALMGAEHAVGIESALAAATLARRLGAVAVEFEASCLQGVALAQAGRPAEGIAVIETWLAWVDREATPQQRGRFWSDYAYALNAARRLRETGRALERAQAVARELGDLAELATLTSNMATVQGNLGQVDAALGLAEQALALQAGLGATDGPEGGVVETYVGYYAGMVGRYATALDHLERALEVFRRDRQIVWIAVAANHLVQVLCDVGQHARAWRALDYERPGVRSVVARRATLEARLARSTGRAVPPLQEVVATLSDGDDALVRMHLELEMARADDPDAAVTCCEAVERRAAALELAGVALKARLRGIEALLAAGRLSQAAAAAQRALADLDRMHPADLYVGEAWWIVAQALAAGGAGDEGLVALARGAQWVRRVALPQVPDSFRESFLQRNPVNRALLAAADQRALR